MDIILISPKENRRFNLHVRSGFLVAGGIFLVLLLTFFVYNVTVFASHKVDQNRLTQLHTENRIVRQEIERIEQEFQELTIFIDSLQMYDKQLRAYVSLEPIDDDLRAMGVGGEVLNFYDEIDLSTEVKDNLTSLSTALDNLLARSRLQKESFNELIASLEEKRYLRDRTPSIIPVQGWFMSGFGYRLDPFTGRVKMHEGLDIAAPLGTPIVAPAHGRVSFVGDRQGFGLTIEIDHGYGFSTRFAHCQRIKAQVGDNVKRGEVIAYVGNTGKSTGPHLHYEVHVSKVPVNPINYILTSKTIID
ncbi:peptidoglycan DD-metalloendopeptidase family protein [candidate division WOR-3 bacterium]|nr:peptidoglycan DD-metalloendopeptidase family protein [candidate division WOR-3 bacterium]